MANFMSPCSFLLRAAMLSPAAFLHAFSLRSFWPTKITLGRDGLTWERGLSFFPLPRLSWTWKHCTLEASYRDAWGSIVWKFQVVQDGWGRIQNLVQRKRLKSSSRNTLFKTLVCLQFKPMYVLSLFQFHLTNALRRITFRRIFSNPD